VAAIVTPPDVVSQTIVAIPMLLIYEASIFISVLVTKKKRIIMSAIIEEFNDYRSKMNEKLLADNNKIVKRIFNLDTNAYAAGALDKTKELLGLVASAVLRCDDCVKYHLETSHKIGVTKEEMMEAMELQPMEPS
jgi:AhpD family alkylhydroperoxidase